MKISMLLETPPLFPLLPPPGTFGHWCEAISISLLIITALIWIFASSYRKLWVTICRIVVGALFIFSGFVKADDPTGFDIKLKEYFAPDALNLCWLDKFSFPMAFSFSIIEMILGVMILIGARKRLSLTLIVLMTTFFTFLTFYTSHYNKVNECGCFGDAIPLTALESFWKNVVLMAFILITIFGSKHISPLIQGKAQNAVVLICLAGFTAFSWYCYNYLPVMDFRPYKVGTDIKKAMKGVPGIDKYYYTCTNKKTGEQQEFGSMPDSMSWKYVCYRTETIKKGTDPVDFNISAITGEDVTDSILSIPTYNFLLVSTYINESSNDPDVAKKINELSSECIKNHIGFICLTNSGEDDINAYRKKYKPTYKFFNTDEVVLKTMIRSNPGLILIKGGVVKAMWHFHSIPSYSEFTQKYPH